MRNKRKLHSTARHKQLLAGTVVCGTVGQSLSLPGQTEGAGHCLLLSWAVKCIGRHKCACSESWGAQHREDEFSLPHCLVPELFGTATRYQSLSGALKSYFQAIPCTTATASSLLGFTDKPFHFYAVACHQNTAGNGCVCRQTCTASPWEARSPPSLAAVGTVYAHIPQKGLFCRVTWWLCSPSRGWGNPAPRQGLDSWWLLQGAC